jgi:2-dehydropantoate 2-reductase
MRIAVIGPGAVGGVIAAWLAQNRDLVVEVCARTAFDRLEVETPG